MCNLWCAFVSMSLFFFSIFNFVISHLVIQLHLMLILAFIVVLFWAYGSNLVIDQGLISGIAKKRKNKEKRKPFQIILESFKGIISSRWYAGNILSYHIVQASTSCIFYSAELFFCLEGKQKLGVTEIHNVSDHVMRKTFVSIDWFLFHRVFQDEETWIPSLFSLYRIMTLSTFFHRMSVNITIISIYI
jgi:hypothetical protein